LAGALLGLAAFGLYAGYDVTIKFFGGILNPLQVLFCAAAFSAPMYLLHLLATGQGRNLWPEMPRWTLARIAVTLVNGVLGAYAFSVLPLAETYAIMFLMPVLISLLAWPVLGERIDLARGMAILAGFAGVVLSLGPAAGLGGLQLGHLSALGGATLGAMNYIIVRRTSGVEKTGVILLYPTLAMAICLGLLMPGIWQPMTLSQWGLTFLMALELYVGGFAIVAAYRHAPAIVVAPMQYSQIVWAAIFGWLLFSEVISPATALGIGVVISAGLFLLWRSNRN